MRIAALLLGLTACSPLFMETLPRDYAGTTAPHCTSTKGFAIWDGANAAGYIALAVAASAHAEDLDEQRMDVPAYVPIVALGSVIAGIAHFGASMWGVQQADRCVKARADHERLR